MTAYRERPPNAVDLAQPEHDAPWYEQLAWQVVLAHQPAPARVERPRGPTPLQMVRYAARIFRPHCLRCSRDVERVETYAEPYVLQLVVVAHCHGAEESWKVDEWAIKARAGDERELAIFLADQLRREVFKP